MTLTIGIVTSLVVLGMSLWRHRLRYLRERPFEHDGETYAGPSTLAAALGRAAGLTPSQGPVGWAWLADFALWPVLLLWGDLRLGRAETQLARWTLAGQRPSGRDATIRMHPDRVTLNLRGDVPPLHAVRGEPLERQEPMRALHPIGGDAWRAATAKIEALFELGADEVRVAAGHVVAVVPRERLTAARIARQLDALEELARELEAI